MSELFRGELVENLFGEHFRGEFVEKGFCREHFRGEFVENLVEKHVLRAVWEKDVLKEL